MSSNQTMNQILWFILLGFHVFGVCLGEESGFCEMNELNDYRNDKHHAYTMVLLPNNTTRCFCYLSSNGMSPPQHAQVDLSLYVFRCREEGSWSLSVKDSSMQKSNVAGEIDSSAKAAPDFVQCKESGSQNTEHYTGLPVSNLWIESHANYTLGNVHTKVEPKHYKITIIIKKRREGANDWFDNLQWVCAKEHTMFASLEKHPSFIKTVVGLVFGSVLLMGMIWIVTYLLSTYRITIQTQKIPAQQKNSEQTGDAIEIHTNQQPLECDNPMYENTLSHAPGNCDDTASKGSTNEEQRDKVFPILPLRFSIPLPKPFKFRNSSPKPEKSSGGDLVTTFKPHGAEKTTEKDVYAMQRISSESYLSPIEDYEVFCTPDEIQCYDSTLTRENCSKNDKIKKRFGVLQWLKRSNKPKNKNMDELTLKTSFRGPPSKEDLRPPPKPARLSREEDIPIKVLHTPMKTLVSASAETAFTPLVLPPLNPSLSPHVASPGKLPVKSHVKSLEKSPVKPSMSVKPHTFTFEDSKTSEPESSVLDGQSYRPPAPLANPSETPTSPALNVSPKPSVPSKQVVSPRPISPLPITSPKLTLSPLSKTSPKPTSPLSITSPKPALSPKSSSSKSSTSKPESNFSQTLEACLKSPAKNALPGSNPGTKKLSSSPSKLYAKPQIEPKPKASSSAATVRPMREHIEDYYDNVPSDQDDMYENFGNFGTLPKPKPLSGLGDAKYYYDDAEEPEDTYKTAPPMSAASLKRQLNKKQ